MPRTHPIFYEHPVSADISSGRVRTAHNTDVRAKRRNLTHQDGYPQSSGEVATTLVLGSRRARLATLVASPRGASNEVLPSGSDPRSCMIWPLARWSPATRRSAGNDASSSNPASLTRERIISRSRPVGSRLPRSSSSISRLKSSRLSSVTAYCSGTEAHTETPTFSARRALQGDRGPQRVAEPFVRPGGSARRCRGRHRSGRSRRSGRPCPRSGRSTGCSCCPAAPPARSRRSRAGRWRPSTSSTRTPPLK